MLCYVVTAYGAQVGEESAHLLQMGVVLTDFVPKIREFLSASYFNTFCTRLATEMLQRYVFIDPLLVA